MQIGTTEVGFTGDGPREGAFGELLAMEILAALVGQGVIDPVGEAGRRRADGSPQEHQQDKNQPDHRLQPSGNQGAGPVAREGGHAEPGGGVGQEIRPW